MIGVVKEHRIKALMETSAPAEAASKMANASVSASSVPDATSEPIVVIVIGMAGSGKTTLMQVGWPAALAFRRAHYGG